MALDPQPFSEARDRSLVVLLHAFRHTPARLDAVARVVRQNKTAPHILVPPLPLSMWSRADLTDVAVEVVDLIDQQVQHRESNAWLPFDEIILVGHSTGSMISRKAYVILCGEVPPRPSSTAIHRTRLSGVHASRGRNRSNASCSSRG
jgi:alpha-beta hydrolase superfamily lysophospholipase